MKAAGDACSHLACVRFYYRTASQVLDMCAAPGSKTAQIIEMLHDDSKSVPGLCVLATEAV